MPDEPPHQQQRQHDQRADGAPSQRGDNEVAGHLVRRGRRNRDLDFRHARQGNPRVYLYRAHRVTDGCDEGVGAASGRTGLIRVNAVVDLCDVLGEVGSHLTSHRFDDVVATSPGRRRHAVAGRIRPDIGGDYCGELRGVVQIRERVLAGIRTARPGGRMTTVPCVV